MLRTNRTFLALALSCSLAPLSMVAQRHAPTPEQIAADDASVTPTPTWAVPANPQLKTLWLVGDSTMHKADGHGAGGMWGWGEPIAALFDLSKINVVNRAIGGRSSRSFIEEGHWDDVLHFAKPGDIVIVQFGHNDPIPPHATAIPERSTLPGIGDETRESAMDGGPKETVHTYGWYLKKYVADARAHHLVIILCSPVPRKVWKDGRIASFDTTYAPWAAQVAQQQHVDFLDLYGIISGEYNAQGQEKVEGYFGDAGTHTNLTGARINAAAVVAGLRALPDHPVAGYLSPAGEAIPAYGAPK